MTEQGIKSTSHVTSCQIIVEQAIRSGKTFKLVHNEVSVTHIFTLDKLLKVICIICSLWCPLSTELHLYIGVCVLLILREKPIDCYRIFSTA